MQEQWECANQQRSIDRLLAQIQEEFFEGHRVIVDADDKVAELREEELDVLVRKLAELAAEDIVNAYVIGITAVWGTASS